MKKILFLCWGLFVVLGIHAQNDFPLQFTDKDGNVIADGSILERTTVETDAFGTVVMPSQLWVGNVTDKPVQAGASYSIIAISNGVLQTCFPANCVRQTECGAFTTEAGEMAAGERKDMLTEWLPDAEGSCSLTYQLKTYRQNPNNGKWMVDGIGPQVTLIFNYGNPTVIDSQQTEKNIVSTLYYNLQGQLVKQPCHGLLVRKVTYSDGSTRTLKHYNY